MMQLLPLLRSAPFVTPLLLWLLTVPSPRFILRTCLWPSRVQALRGGYCHIHANSDTSPTCSDASPICSDASPTNSDVSPICSDASPTNSDISPISSDISPINSDVSPPNSYSVPPVRPAHFCHTFRYIPCFHPVTYLSPCCYLLLPCVYPFHVFPPLMCFSYSVFHMSCVYHKDPVLSVSI